MCCLCWWLASVLALRCTVRWLRCVLARRIALASCLPCWPVTTLFKCTKHFDNFQRAQPMTSLGDVHIFTIHALFCLSWSLRFVYAWLRDRQTDRQTGRCYRACVVCVSVCVCQLTLNTPCLTMSSFVHTGRRTVYNVCLSLCLSVSAMHGSAWLSVTLIDGRTLAACRRDVMVLRAVPLQMTVTHSLVLNWLILTYFSLSVCCVAPPRR